MIGSLRSFRALRLSAAVAPWVHVEGLLADLHLQPWEETLLRDGLLATIIGARAEERYYLSMMTSYDVERRRRQQPTPPTGFSTPPATLVSFDLSSGLDDSEDDSASTFGDELDAYAALPAGDEIKEERVPTPLPFEEDEIKEERSRSPSPPVTRFAARKRGRDDDDVIKQEPKRQHREAKSPETGERADLD